MEQLPKHVKAKSRIERLVRYQTITSAKSYFESEVATKQEPTFSPYLNLGAVDNQMANVEFREGKIELVFKCWDQEYLLKFSVPEFVLSRNIAKITLPVIKPMGEDWGFLFTVEETKAHPTINPEYVMGVDLGRVEPYTLVVVHVKTGSRVAQYTATPRRTVIPFFGTHHFVQLKDGTYADSLGIWTEEAFFSTWKSIDPTVELSTFEEDDAEVRKPGITISNPELFNAVDELINNHINGKSL